jgi:hypothetical protein
MLERPCVHEAPVRNEVEKPWLVEVGGCELVQLLDPGNHDPIVDESCGEVFSCEDVADGQVGQGIPVGQDVPEER